MILMNYRSSDDKLRRYVIPDASQTCQNYRWWQAWDMNTPAGGIKTHSATAGAANTVATHHRASVLHVQDITNLSSQVMYNRQSKHLTPKDENIWLGDEDGERGRWKKSCD